MAFQNLGRTLQQIRMHPWHKLFIPDYSFSVCSSLVVQHMHIYSSYSPRQQRGVSVIKRVTECAYVQMFGCAIAFSHTICHCVCSPTMLHKCILVTHKHTHTHKMLYWATVASESIQTPAKTWALPKLIKLLSELIDCSLLYPQQSLLEATLLRTKLQLYETSHRPAPSKPQKNLFIAPLIVLSTYQTIPE